MVGLNSRRALGEGVEPITGFELPGVIGGEELGRSERYVALEQQVALEEQDDPWEAFGNEEGGMQEAALV